MKYIKIVVIVILIFCLGCFIPYKYSNQKAINYIQINSENHSRTMCAWYVMKGLQNGGCPCGIYPAYAYSDILPRLGFQEVNSPQIGDICVLSNNSKHPFGHIAIYDGNIWISDYKQKSIYPSKIYKNESDIRYFRQTDGWHTANIWINPLELFEYINILFNNYKKIKI